VLKCTVKFRLRVRVRNGVFADVYYGIYNLLLLLYSPVVLQWIAPLNYRLLVTGNGTGTGCPEFWNW